MSATPEQLDISRVKALQSPNIGKRGEGKKTLEMKERRAIFEEIVTEDFPKIIKAAKPEYKLDQFLGRAPEKIDVEVKITPIFGGRSVKNHLPDATKEIEEVKEIEEPKEV